MKAIRFTLMVLCSVLLIPLMAQETIETEGAIKIGDTPNESAGIIKWNGVDFLAYDGVSWLPLTPLWSQSGNKIYYNADNVGIGTTDPLAKLHVVGGNLRIDGSNDIQWYEGANLKAWLDYDGTNFLMVNNEGGGQMTLQTEALLTLAAYGGSDVATLQSDGALVLNSDDSNGAQIRINDENENEMIRLIANETSTSGSELRMRNANSFVTVELDAHNSSQDGGVLFLNNALQSNRVRLEALQTPTLGAILELKDFDGSTTAIMDGDNGGQGGLFQLENEFSTPMIVMLANETSSEGSVLRMHDQSYSRTITIDADDAGLGGEILIEDGSSALRMSLEADEASGNGAALKLYNGSGQLAIELDAQVGSGPARIYTEELQINGGSDLAEHFDIRSDEDGNDILPGMLVSIDPAAPGALARTESAYDHKVVGVISGANGVNPGMLMGQKGTVADGEFPVALAGRVYVYCNNESGNIKPGDLLTSSSTPGYAMKVKKHKKAKGAIIGKAITALDDESGFVLVLVTLQ